MKKFLYPLFILVILIGSFLAGSWYGRREPTKNIPSTEKSKLLDAERRVGDNTQNDALNVPAGTVKITPEKQQLIGVKSVAVEKRSDSQSIRILGRVAVDETRVYRINATVDGWITKALPTSTGIFVKKNETLATFYSPEFLSAGQALLFALNSMDRVQATGKETPAQKDQITQFSINLKQYRDSLKNLGMGDLQIDEMIRTRKYMENVDITSPADGFILIRNVSDGQRFDKGTELYRIADLSHVWVLTDTYEDEARHLPTGKSVKVSLPPQKKTFTAKVSKALPQFDTTTRTLKVRLEINNPEYTLKPDMFVDIELPIQLPPAITVPADAILDSGVKKTVFVDRGNGFFEPREVETGWRMGNWVEIVRGLEVGERIVTSGTFLIDSESKLELAAQGMYTTLSKDPVCGAEVSQVKAEKAGRKVSFKGKNYYFDSDECKDQFQKNPEKFLKETAEGTPSEKGPAPKVPAKRQEQDHRHG
jgi:Cu(I)/Ag(I) efflux system membrane fusion protein